LNKPEITSPSLFHHFRDGTPLGAVSDVVEKLGGVVSDLFNES
jgi:hypothetical protein